MKTTTTLTLLLLTVVAGCEGPPVAETAEYDLGRQIIETIAEHVGEDPSDLMVREEALETLDLLDPGIAEVAAAIRSYVDRAGLVTTDYPNGTDYFNVPRLIWHLGPVLWRRHEIAIRYREIPGILPSHCSFGMPVAPLEDGRWEIGTLRLHCHGGSAPW